MIKPVPDGYHTVTPFLAVMDALNLLEFMKKAFGATERFKMVTPDGKKLVHAEMAIGDSVVMVGEPDGANVRTGMLHLYVPDVDATYRRAIEAGGTPLREPANQFYGDRSGGVKDAWGMSGGSLRTSKT
jgi:PhnB protein